MAKPWEQYGAQLTGPWSQYQQPTTAPLPKPTYQPSPYEFQVDISSPRSDTTMERMGKGALIGLRTGGKGLKGLMAGFVPGVEMTPSDIAELEQMKAYTAEAGWPAMVGQTLEQIPQYAVATGLGPASMLGRAVSSGIVGGMLAPENRLTEAALGAGGSAIGEGLTGMAAKIARGPIAQEYVKPLWEKGVKPTLAQALGGGWKTAEEKMTSIPLVGSAIEKAQRRGLESFNKASLQGVIDELNTGLQTTSTSTAVISPQMQGVAQKFTNIGDIELGAKGFEKVYKAVGSVYDDLAKNSSGELTPELQDSFLQLRDMAAQIEPKAQSKFDALLKDTVLSKIKDGQRIPGETFKLIDRDLDKLIASLENPNKGSTDNLLGKAFQQVKAEMINMMENQNPGYADILRNADAAYRKLALLGKASTSSVGSELATPANLLQQLRAEDTSSWKGGFAMNKAPWTDWARQNLELMGNKFPESGTAARSSIADLFAAGVGHQLGILPEALATYAAAKGVWSPAVQDFLVKQAMKQPGPTRAKAALGLAGMARPASTIGAAYSTNR